MRKKKVDRRMPKIYGNMARSKPKVSIWPIIRRIIILGIAFALLWLIFISPAFQIKSVVIEGNKFVSTEEIKAKAPIGSNIFLLQSESLISDINKNSNIRSTQVFRGLPDTLKIVINEKKTGLLWISGDNAYCLDENGIAFYSYKISVPPDPNSALGIYLSIVPKIIDTKVQPFMIGDTVVGIKFVSFINQILESQRQYLPNYKVSGFEIGDTTYDVIMNLEVGTKVLINSLGDAGPPMRNLSRLIDQKKINLKSQVDLRIDNWAYVKPI